jgi:uncharacterized protein (TIGR03032 family)
MSSWWNRTTGSVRWVICIWADPTARSRQPAEFQRAMGVSWQNGRFYLGALLQLWQLENMLRLGELGNQVFDAVLVPRNAQTTGDVDIHELGIDTNGRVLFVNTKYSCLCTLDLTHSFKSLWKPPFISRLTPENRCHMDGLAMDKG